MVSVLVVVTLAAAPPKLAMPDMNAVNLEPKVAAFLSEHLAQQLKANGLEVVTAREISSLLGLERQKALLGCSTDSSNCIAELASALGADGMVLVDLAKLDGTLRLNLKVIHATTGKTLSTCSERASSEDAAADAMTRCAAQVATDLGVGARQGSGSRVLRPLVLVPIGVGAVAAAVGGFCFVQGNGAYRQLTRMDRITPLTTPEATSLRDGGKRDESLGVGLWIAGGALVAAGVAIAIVNPGSPPVVTPTVAPVSGGAVLGLGGAW